MAPAEPPCARSPDLPGEDRGTGALLLDAARGTLRGYGRAAARPWRRVERRASAGERVDLLARAHPDDDRAALARDLADSLGAAPSRRRGRER